jgi:serine/threonine protein kinase
MIRRAEFRMPQHVSDPAQHLLQRLLTRDPSARITLAELRQHSWFSIVPPDHYSFVSMPIKVRSPTFERQVTDLTLRQYETPIGSLDDLSDIILDGFQALGWNDKDQLETALQSPECVSKLEPRSAYCVFVPDIVLCRRRSVERLVYTFLLAYETKKRAPCVVVFSSGVENPLLTRGLVRTYSERPQQRRIAQLTEDGPQVRKRSESLDTAFPAIRAKLCA